MDRLRTRALLDAWFASAAELLEEILEKRETLPGENLDQKDTDAA